MSSKIEGRSSRHDLIDDIVETPSSTFISNSISSLLIDGSKALLNGHYASIPSLFNNKSKFEHTDHPSIMLTNELRDRLHLTLPRSVSSTIIMTNDERRKELDLIIKHLYDGKLLTSINDDRPLSDVSEPPIYMLSKGPITTTTMKSDDESRTVANIDLLSLDGDATSLQRELQEKELDIIHLHKEIQELQIENKILKAKVPTVHQNGYISSNSESEVLRREKDVLENELRTSQELIGKLHQQHHQKLIIARSNRTTEVTVHQKEILEKKLRSYEKEVHILTNENDKLKENSHQTERTIGQLKRENNELQQKITDAKKRNNELFYQEFNSLRNDLKLFKQRNNELLQENHRLQQEQHNVARRSSIEQQSIPFTPSSLKLPHSDSKHERTKIIRSESPNISEASDSTNYLTTVSVERYNNRPSPSIHRSATLDGNIHYRPTRYNSITGQEDFNRNNYSSSLSKSLDQQLNFRPSKTKRTVEWDEDNIQANEGLHHRDITNYDDDHQITLSSHFYEPNYPLHRSVTLNETQNHSRRSMSSDTNIQQDDRRQIRTSVETPSPRRPYAPSSISDIRLNDVIKFSRPGGKISKGIVKYTGKLPGKNDQYIGLELEDEESKHDGIYQGQRLFQCKPNKGVFVAFNKVIMAWSGR